ncbi:hypothetical protein BD780_000916 [Clostridium tetanomorphum]|nr:hypothetical protein [Clostridium tetanomorphum]KAJ50914.1 hypothetical protein CTM_15398 [Clostridium tetanomorphum DSM 665]MBP1864243.1 hypothetical protein [Clostridium tetanomorphum]NRS83691.1 hypothetical protein [Clostridium tetanomorphum]NRZ96882.1 hypothetical protein [Clostridium tetanomorphum]SQC02099.1 Uncharacterised protein [Clostridium tetanomorphum]
MVNGVKGFHGFLARKIENIGCKAKYSFEDMGQYIRSVLYEQHQYALPNGGKITTSEDLFKFAKSEGNIAKGAGKAVNNMSEFFKTEFGGTIKNGLNKTKQQFQGQSIYEVTNKIDSPYLKKGDQLYLDNLHKDHIEVFDKRGNAKAVLNLDGTLNVSKTESALKEGRKIGK